jgi:hypothetical protein
MERLRVAYALLNCYLYATDLIQTSRLVLGREIPLSALDSTLGKPPHRDTLLENIIKNLEGGREGARP